MKTSFSWRVPEGLAGPDSPTTAAALAFAERELRRVRDSNTTLVLRLPLAATTDGRGLLGLSTRGFGWWSRDDREPAPAARTIDVAVGAAAVLRTDGASRFVALRRAARELWRNVEVASMPGTPPIEPRLFGGFAFQPGSAARPPWQELGDATFVLPRLWCHRQADRCLLSAAFGPRELARRRPSDLVGELDRALALLENPMSWQHGDERCAGVAVTPPLPGDQEFRNRVASIRDAIRRGEVVKVVAARRLELVLGRAIDLLGAASRLTALDHQALSFALRFQESVFLGATPERLVCRRGRAVVTEALAGSCGADEPGAEERLEASAKDLAEHAPVARHVAGRLRAFCSHLDWSETPRVRRAGRLLHLRTPVRGRLRWPVHVLDLAAALHPTPAVAGVPGAAAARWIACEPHARGWYAAPLGWFDRSGDGDLAVALRSAVVSARRVYLWAGAGIVSGSDPGAEARETELKLATMLDVLGESLPEAAADGPAVGRPYRLHRN